MEKLKIWFADFWPEWNQEDFITPILKQHFEVVLDKNNPDVVFHSIFNRMQETPKYKCKKILYLGENWRPEPFKSNYSISFDPHSTELKDRLYNRLNRKEEEFQQWCAFTVSNASNFMRNSAFQQLSQYKPVRSYGRYLTNDFALIKASEGKYWRDIKDEFFLNRPHKFMMTYENTSYRFYCTEKLMDAFLVGSMPIYMGDPKVAEDFNPGAFINVMKNTGWLDEIKRIDGNREYFNHYYKEPVFTPEQKEKLEENLKTFEAWLINVVKK
jgi:hypothetical protein